MTDTRHLTRAAVIGLLIVTARPSGAGITNGMPWAESFESYSSGLSIAGTNGWASDRTGAGAVATNPAVVGALTNYPLGGRSFPLTYVTHSNVLQTVAEVRNEIRSTPGTGVALDFMAVAEPVDLLPQGDPLHQYSFCVLSNRNVAIWHRNMTGGAPGNNEWLELAVTPQITTGAWTRFTVVQDYAHNMFQLRVNEGAALTNAAGWTDGGGAQSGSWFYMVQTNGLMSRFRIGSESTNYMDDVAVTFDPPGSISYETNVFVETVQNNGAVGGTTLTLTNSAFNATNGEDLVSSMKVTTNNVPPGLALHVVVTDSQHATLSFTGSATTHAALDSITNLTLIFGDGAFVGGKAEGVTYASRSDLRVSFADPTALSATGVIFTEAGANNGTIGNNNTVNLAGDLFVSSTFTEGVHYMVTNVPPGLNFGVVGAGASATVTLTGTAVVHTAGASVPAMTLRFLDAAFVSGSATGIQGNPIDYAVNFADPASVDFSRSSFTETSGGLIDNRTPMTITLTGDVFAGSEGDDFVDRGWATVADLPGGLTALITRDSATQLSVRLNGVATSNSSGNSTNNVSITLLDSSFANVAASLVVGNPKTGISVTFVDDTGFFNVMPYEEPFERYANGTFLVGTNGWTGAFADSGIVTNDPAVSGLLPDYLKWHTGYPVTGTHTQLLFVQNAVGTEIHSEGSPLVYLDFMTIPIPLELDVENHTNSQYEFYVSTNQQLVVWHRNTAGGAPVNEWRTLAGAGLVSTSQWVRFTVVQDYSTHRFQIRVDEGLPVSDPVAWNDAGTGHPGTWFNMVQTNASMTRFRMTGFGEAFVDDLTLRTTPPARSGGSIYTIR